MKTFWLMFWRLITADLWRKLLALVFAVLVYYAAQEQISERLDIPEVEVNVQPPAGFVLMGSERPSVTLVVKGTQLALDAARSRSFGSIKLKESDFKRGKSCRVKLYPSDFSVPAGVRVIGVEPAELSLPWQNVITREIDVKPIFRGQLGPDYACTATRCVPTKVDVTGPESLVNSMQEVRTEEIPLDRSVTETFGYKAKLEKSKGLLFGTKDGEVDVTVAIEKNRTTHVFSSLPVRLMIPLDAPPSMRTARPETQMVEVTVKGLKRSIAELVRKRDEIRPYIDLSRPRAPGVYEMRVNCFVNGEDLDVVGIVPKTIKVRISK